MLARLVPILVGLALVVPAAAVADDHEDSPNRGPESVLRGEDARPPAALERTARNDSDDEDDEKDDDAADGARRPKNLGNGPGAGIGTFEVTPATRSIDGDFVSFDYFPTTIENASAGGLFLFRVEVTGPDRFDSEEDDEDDMPAGVKSRGSVVTVVTSAYKLKAHDNPNALVHFESADAYAVSFPAGASLREQGDFIEVVYPDGRIGRLFADDDISIVGPRVTGDEDFKFMLDAKRGQFDTNRTEIGRAMAKKHVGAEVTIGKPDGPTGKLREEVVTFGNVSVTTRAQRGNVTLIVDGHGFDGRVLVLNVDPSLFGVSHKKDFRVLFDNVTIAEASNFTDATNPDDDGLNPEYVLVAGADGVQLVVTVPHYSVHTLTLAELIVEAPPSVIVGFVAGTILVAAGGFVLFRRR